MNIKQVWALYRDWSRLEEWVAPAADVIHAVSEFTEFTDDQQNTFLMRVKGIHDRFYVHRRKAWQAEYGRA